MTQTNELKIAQLDQALKALGDDFNGFGGNCARVACVLDEILETDGDFVVVSGEHYEFVDHVFLRWEGLLWDMNGAYTPAEAHQAWCADDDEPTELEDFTDPSHSVIISTADINGIFAGGFDQEEFAVQLRTRLQAQGWPLEISPPSSPRAPRPSPRSP